MKTDGLTEAVGKLAEREGCDRERIGCWPDESGSAEPPTILGLEAWAASKGVDHVIWTALGPKFLGDDGRAPTVDQAVAYLQKLSDEGNAGRAEEYVRRAPRQVDTRYRKRIVRCLGRKWEAASDAECEQATESAAKVGAPTSRTSHRKTAR